MDKDAHDVVGEIAAVEREVDVLRQRTQSVVNALQSRLSARKHQVSHAVGEVKRLTNVRAQAASHPIVAGGLGLVTVVAGGLVGLVLYRVWQRQRTLPRRLRRRARAYGTLLADPERVLRPREPVATRLVGAILVAGATAASRGLVERFVQRSPVRPRPRPI